MMRVIVFPGKWSSEKVLVEWLLLPETLAVMKLFWWRILWHYHLLRSINPDSFNQTKPIALLHCPAAVPVTDKFLFWFGRCFQDLGLIYLFFLTIIIRKCMYMVCFIAPRIFSSFLLLCNWVINKICNIRILS